MRPSIIGAMHSSPYIRSMLLLLLAALLLPVTLAARNFVKPVAKSAFNYPAHDFHRD